jgi:ABC-type lipoprotein release transport system permease subunit
MPESSTTTPALKLGLPREELGGLSDRAWRATKKFVRGLGRLLGTLFTIGFSLLPLSALLIALPAVSPNEAVLSETIRPVKSWWRRTARRVLALLAGLAVLVVLLAFAIEVVSHFPADPSGQLGTLAKKVFSYSVADFVPNDAKPSDHPPLKGLFERRDAARKALVTEELEPEAQRERAAEVAAVNVELAEWAEQEPNRWMIPPELLAARQKAAESASAGKGAVEAKIADRVEEVTKQWLPAEELLGRRATLHQAASRPNQGPIERADASEKLAEVEREIAERTPKSPRLKLLLDRQLQPILGVPLWMLLPPTLVTSWPFVFLVMYATDLLLLLLIGKVPLAYNFRYLWVRRRDTLLTALAFTVVVALVVILLAFVNGMYKLNESTGVPGNVLVMSEGSTDELFSNLARSDSNNVERQVISRDREGRAIGPVGVARGVIGPDGRVTRIPADAPQDQPGAIYLASLESYLVMNQPVPTKPGEAPRRRFLQLRAHFDVRVSAAVHNIDLEPGGSWFSAQAVDTGAPAPDGLKYLQCTIGEGAAATLGEDAGKKRLAVGDTFELGDRWWKVTGIMNTRGTTYGSEVWTSVENPIVRASGKGDKFTTMVLRMADDSEASAKAMAYFLNELYTEAKLKAFAEPDYYKELTKTNEQFLTAIVMVAIIMAVGGVFGVMNTMFASIAARIKEVGVLRILGFKRWQILISFMLESLAIGLVGGLIGCAIGALANGYEAASTLSGSSGGGKSVTLTMIVDTQILAAGLLFTLVMGRLGGLVPALSAMRMEILESLR